jgi:hypothetical protein
VGVQKKNSSRDLPGDRLKAQLRSSRAANG